MHAIQKSDANLLERPFRKMGARVRFENLRPRRWDFNPASVLLNVREDKHGEYFLVSKIAEVRVEVLEVRPEARHLLLMTRRPGRNREIKARFLLGHDERHWFVAAIPEQKPVTTVAAAMQALKPEEVVNRERGIRLKSRNRRVNGARVRQGEWFFVPAGNVQVDLRMVLKNEPLRRGRGKPHVCQELWRDGGEVVYVNRRNPNGLTQAEFARLSEDQRRRPGWNRMVRNPRVLIRGTVRHSDHKTIFLNGWHQVFMNTETQAVAMRNVAFLD
jgi:hypothetical protein